MAHVAVLPIHEVVRRLPLKDWLHLCDEVDKLFGKTEEIGTTRGASEIRIRARRSTKEPLTAAIIPGKALVAERPSSVKFDVLDVVRVENELNVTVQTDPSRVAVRITLKAAA